LLFSVKHASKIDKFYRWNNKPLTNLEQVVFLQKGHRIMSDQEREEQAQAVNKFHDKHSYSKPPDWLSAEAKAEVEAKEQINKSHFYDLGHHAVELDQQGRLVLYESSTRIALSAEEVSNLLMLLHDNHPETLHQLAQQPGEPEP
jgi:hypothetical protein